MKQFLFSLTLSLGLFSASFGQFNVSVAAGYSLGKSPLGAFDLGYNARFFNVRVGAIVHTTPDVNKGSMVFTARLGHTFDISDRFYGSPGAGYAYVYKSQDIKGINYNAFLANLELGYKYEFREQPMAVYLSGTKAGDNKMILVGVRGFF